jgi:hypothetical protein
MQSRKQIRRPRRKQNVNRIPQTLSDGPAYAGQQSTTLTLPGQSALLTTTVTTGVIAHVVSLSFAATQGFSTRFGSTFDEARLLGVNVVIRPIAASTGVTVFFFDEKSSAAPALIDAQERRGLRLANTNASERSGAVMRWRARDLVDLEYSPIGSAASVVFFKAYTDLANYGAPIAVTNLWTLDYELIVEFRGLKAA